MHHHFGATKTASCGKKDVPMTAHEPSVTCEWCQVYLFEYHERFPLEGRR
jgi:hypothetical protein